MQNAAIASAQDLDLLSFDFNDFPLTDDETCIATVRMFLELDIINKFHVPYEVRGTMPYKYTIVLSLQGLHSAHYIQGKPHFCLYFITLIIKSFAG